jgi:hypothetical protein
LAPGSRAAGGAVGGPTLARRARRGRVVWQVATRGGPFRRTASNAAWGQFPDGRHFGQSVQEEVRLFGTPFTVPDRSALATREGLCGEIRASAGFSGYGTIIGHIGRYPNSKPAKRKAASHSVHRCFQSYDAREQSKSC